MSDSMLQREITLLRQQLYLKQKLLQETQPFNKLWDHGLSTNEIARSSRQIILPEVGIQGQNKLKNASVLIVGCGGLGCPAALYLVGAGIGNIGLVDYDRVEINNLHRQLLYTESSIGVSKCESAKDTLSLLNSSIRIEKYDLELSSQNAMEIIQNYDIVLDATDNVATRYLLNDACVLAKKPLVSGSALMFEGQLTIYNYSSGPCYRCIFPTPPPPEAVTNCGDGGVIGAVPGVIGTLQALEAIKIILNLDGHLAGRLLLFDGSQCSFRTVKLRGKRENCNICSDNPTITQLIDYELFCGMKASDKDTKLRILKDEDRISVDSYILNVHETTEHLLIDVRSAIEFEIFHLPNSINIPIKDILNDWETAKKLLETPNHLPVFVICRRGNDSQRAVNYINSREGNDIKAKDIVGGLHSWALTHNPTFPIY